MDSYHRSLAVEIVRGVLLDENVLVLPQTHSSFLNGLTLYENRLDKGHSLTDCISMNTCRDQGIAEVLTNDRHFVQEGFSVLISRRIV